MQKTICEHSFCLSLARAAQYHIAAAVTPRSSRNIIAFILNEYVTALLTRQRPDRASRFTHFTAGCFLLDYWTTG